MEWFNTVFLPSLVERAANNPNPKYRDRVILSPKQCSICERYMTPRQCHGDYGYFTNLEHQTETHRFQMCQAGKYTFLYIYNK